MTSPVTVDDPLATIARFRLLPVVVLERAADAVPLVAALAAGGLPVAEVTFRTSAAADGVRAIAERGDVLVGAGTVVSVAQVDAAVRAGARFIVSPGLSKPVVRRCQELGVPVVPGISTATEVLAALDLGVKVVKFFPAQVSGGVAGVAALAAVFAELRFIPTGGIGVDLLSSYLRHPAVAAVGGSWMVASSLIATGDFAEISRRAAHAVAVAASTRVNGRH